MTINYIPANELILELKNELSSFFERGMLDSSYLYPPIRKCLDIMGIRILPVKSDTIRIENFKGELPCNFHKLTLAIGCDIENLVLEPDYLNSHLIETPVCESDFVNTCKTVCDVCSDSCNNLFEIKQYFNTYAVEYKDMYPLKVTNGARPYCTEECFKYQRRGDEIDIKNNHIYTQFESGTIYIEYLVDLFEDGDLMIPDNEVIKGWIKDEMFYACFRKLWRNSEGDVERRYQDAKEQLAISQVNASNVYKRWTVKDFYDLRKTLYSRFHKYNTAVYGKYYNSKLSVKISSSNKGYVFDRFQ